MAAFLLPSMSNSITPNHRGVPQPGVFPCNLLYLPCHANLPDVRFGSRCPFLKNSKCLCVLCGWIVDSRGCLFKGLCSLAPPHLSFQAYVRNPPFSLLWICSKPNSLPADFLWVAVSPMSSSQPGAEAVAILPKPPLTPESSGTSFRILSIFFKLLCPLTYWLSPSPPESTLWLSLSLLFHPCLCLVANTSSLRQLLCSLWEIQSDVERHTLYIKTSREG